MVLFVSILTEAIKYRRVNSSIEVIYIFIAVFRFFAR